MGRIRLVVLRQLGLFGQTLGPLCRGSVCCLLAVVGADLGLAVRTASLFVASKVEVLNAVPLAFHIDVADGLLVPHLGLELDTLATAGAID